MKKMVKELGVMAFVIQSESWTDTAIKAQVEKVSTIATEMAVQRAMVYREVRPILTVEQIQKFMDLQKARDLRMDEFFSRGANKTL
jgi:Spy/CpxP family protein refolding chaperone